MIEGAACLAIGLVAIVIRAASLKSGRWIKGAVVIAIALTVWLVWSLAVLRLDFTVYHTLYYMLVVVWLMLVLDRTLMFATTHPRAADTPPASSKEALTDHGRLDQQAFALLPAARRSIIAIASAITAMILGRVWLVDILDLVPADKWHQVASALGGGLVIMVVGYVSYQAMRAWTVAKFGDPTAALGPTELDEEVAEGSRIGTILPVISGFLLFATALVAVLYALSELGINTTPLLAGAGIFGLALSFGSQALVRDIVSGLFFMIDDAFRIGEYIDTGRHKGTVEIISLRSLRLRHQNGPFHTIPYGQLGAVTNYSRDWATVKFNLRLGRDSDIDKARKLAKQLGQSMLDDPEFGKEFLLPLKMQGVADILENAIVCRFKFTVRPSKPTYVQRECVKRLFKTFSENGIAFASNAVVVKTLNGDLTLTAAGAASTQQGEVVAGGEAAR